MRQSLMVGGLLLLGAAGACGTTHAENSGGDKDAAGAAGASSASGAGADESDAGTAGNGGSDGNVGGSTTTGGGATTAGEAGQTGNGCILSATNSDAGGAGGTASEGEVSGCLTLDMPKAPFLIERMEDPGITLCNPGNDCKIGPWLMAFRALPGGDLEGALVSTQDSLWTGDHVREAAAFRLHAEDGVYRLPSKAKPTLATYTYQTGAGPASVPGVCLAGPGVAQAAEGSGGGRNRGSAFRFFDDNGDGVADAVALDGNVVGLGQRGGDYEDDCSDESFPLRTQGRAVQTAVDLKAEGGVMTPELIVTGGFLGAGSARIYVRDHWVAAQPLSLSGFIYGFRENIVLQPGADLYWRIEASDILDRKVEGEVMSQSEQWLKLGDSSFEQFDSGEAWGTGGAIVEDHCYPNTDLEPVELLPPISGARSLDVSRTRFRFTRTAEQTQLRFVAYGTVGVELAAVGTESAGPFRQKPSVSAADCLQYAAFCAKVPSGELKLYSVPLPPGESDVLLRLANEDGPDWSTGSGHSLCVDDLRLQ